MNLEELEKEQLSIKTTTYHRSYGPHYGPSSHDLRTRHLEWREQRAKEDIAIERDMCPSCGYSMKKEKSPHSSCIYYTCTNPKVQPSGHLFIR